MVMIEGGSNMGKSRLVEDIMKNLKKLYLYTSDVNTEALTDTNNHAALT